MARKRKRLRELHSDQYNERLVELEAICDFELLRT